MTLNQKAAIIEKIKNRKSIMACSNEFCVSKGTICNIKRNAKQIIKIIARTFVGPGKMWTMKKAENPKTIRALYRWFLNQRKRNVPLNGNLIREKAKQLYVKYEGQQGGSFNASSGWFQKWKNRFGIRLLTVSGEKLAAEPWPIEPFKKRLQEKIALLQLTTQQIYNINETALFWKMLPKKTYVSFNEKSAPGGKIPKLRVTLLLGSNATGTHKLVA